MNEPRVVWGQDGWAQSSGWEFVHCATQDGEYTGSCDVWIVVGTGLPSGAYLEEPPTPEPGKAIIREGGTWVLVEDHRGKVAYKKTDRSAVAINLIGEIPDDMTLVPPSSQFDEWDYQSSSWVKNQNSENQWLTERAQELRLSLMSEASMEIATLVDSLDPSVIGDPDDQNQVLLTQWRQYRVSVQAVDVTSHPVPWPGKPGGVS